jgi:hypothetical protein
MEEVIIVTIKIYVTGLFRGSQLTESGENRSAKDQTKNAQTFAQDFY